MHRRDGRALSNASNPSNPGQRNRLTAANGKRGAAGVEPCGRGFESEFRAADGGSDADYST
ncbi:MULTISPECIES: hypothetical protein [Haloferax]|uniref:Uncharacterized protein n=1 Tax=Haloferax massiliensis TaxID=1476858 RepID=A0A0D6JT70_9EURY|nr:MULTISPECIES: hypothetical protein [Haloferax]MDS0240678.1 hypothetical protein [Haloferax sp. S2CR25]MDS0443799.1 hypothetical protein [Haloferax sp. S2CR25-2]CQR50800.1 hypothetical protein BN996_02283 [Haloferax massiliensis]